LFLRIYLARRSNKTKQLISSVIDFLRFFSAIAVFLGHTNFTWFFSGHVNGIGPQNGQDYVIVFFVLSGFVISWALDRKINYNFNQYLIDRLSRLWSVAIPALLIGCCLDYFGKGIHSQTYVNIINTNYSELKFIISGLFFHESWFYSVRPGSNGPFWSLSYEFFYYMIFGSIALLPKLKYKIITGSFFCLFAGPKILILMPCWLVGCGAYWTCKHLQIKLFFAIPLLLISGIFLFIKFYERWTTWTPVIYPELGSPPLFYSAKFYDDYLTSIFFGIMLVCLSYWFPLNKKSNGLFSVLMKKCSQCSFSLYVFHFPIMVFLSALGASGILKTASHLLATVCVFALCIFFAVVFEWPLRIYRKGFQNVLLLVTKKCGIQY
jgi:peptidoglycan/LPS O-acetylase OafA/YrhL